MTENPLPDDIFPREFVFNSSAQDIATRLLPWVTKNPRFTLLCVLRLVGMRLPHDAVHHEHLTRKVQDALSLLHCRPDGYLVETQARIWRYDARRELPIPPLQVEVARAWLREHARPTQTIHKVFSADSYRRLVRAWTRATGAYAQREQENVHTQERYLAPDVYVSREAFHVAAREEGYHSDGEWFNLAHRETGKPWRGSTRPWKEPPPLVPKALVSSERTLVAAWLRRQRKGRLWKLTDAPQVPGVARLLRELGCAHRVLLVKGVRGSFWFVSAGAPLYWSETPRPPPVVALRPLALSKNVITLQEAAAYYGLTPPRRRAPSSLLTALRAAGYERRGGRWVRKYFDLKRLPR